MDANDEEVDDDSDNDDEVEQEEEDDDDDGDGGDTTFLGNRPSRAPGDPHEVSTTSSKFS